MSLLPARNAVEDLHDHLESVGALCDAVVALDDGSTDETRALLEAHAIVRVVLSNPRREGYRGWDDGANRDRLLRAAGELDPDWIVSLDADERIPPDDAAALRDFVSSDALPGCAYGLQHFRMWNEAHDPSFAWVYRLFHFKRGQAFPRRRLHFNPVPTGIPRPAWIRTTIRLQHLGAMTEERRVARLAKYREADPHGTYGANFGGLAEAPARLLPWPPRPPGLPVLAGPEWALGRAEERP